MPVGGSGRADPDDQFARRVKPQIGQVAMFVEGSSSRKLGQPFVEQKMRPVLADATADVRRRIRRIAPARAEVEWVMDRESMGSLVLGRRTDSMSGAVPVDRSAAQVRRTEAGLVVGR